MAKLNDLYNRIETLCKSKGINVTTMCREADVVRGNLSDLKMGRTSALSAKNLSKISAYFGVTMEYLLGGEQKEKAPTPEGERQKNLSGYFRVMQSAKDKGYTPEDMQLALDFLDRARKRDQE